jgi:electron transfer flavoprotein beta subunit
MDIIVAIKVVPDAHNIVVDPVTKTLNRANAKSVINPPDKNAVELALRLKDKYGGKVTVISMGPPWAEKQLRDTIAMGADEAIIITDRYFAGADTYPTSLTLAKTISKMHYDLILCGEETTDSSTAQVGPGIAEHLHLPQVTFSTELSVDENNKRFIVSRKVDGGVEVYSLPMPALVTVVNNMNIPRVPTLKGRIRSKKAKVLSWTLKEVDLPKEWVGLSGSPTKVDEVKTASSQFRNVKILKDDEEGTANEKLLKILIKEDLL